MSNLLPDPDVIRAPEPDELNPPGKLAPGIVNALRDAGITSYVHLSNYSAHALCTLPGMSLKMIPHIKAELERRNLQLKPVGAPKPKAPPVATELSEEAILRDLFAVAALNGLLACPNVRDSRAGLCETAYCFADEMIKAREKAVEP